MMMQVLLGELGEIQVVASGCGLGEGAMDVEFPEDFDFGRQSAYRVAEGRPVYDAELDAEMQRRAAEAEMAAEQADTRQSRVNALVLQAMAPSLTDEQVLTVADAWPELRIGETYPQGTIGWHGAPGSLYQVVAAGGITVQAHQLPGSEGMLAIYRPIAAGADGTEDDLIPFIYGMDVENGKYYSYEGDTYLAKSDMKPCVWRPDTPGLWQWEKVKSW